MRSDEGQEGFSSGVAGFVVLRAHQTRAGERVDPAIAAEATVGEAHGDGEWRGRR